MISAFYDGTTEQKTQSQYAEAWYFISISLSTFMREELISLIEKACLCQIFLTWSQNLVTFFGGSI